MNLASKLSILAAIAMTLTASVAHADDPVAPRPIHKAENISQINGQLVPIGDHNKYDYSYKRVNLATNPIGIMFGVTGVQASYALNHRIALRGDVTLYNNFMDAINGVEMSASVAIYFRQMYQGLYLEPGVMTRSIGVDESRHQQMGLQTLVGYQWMWDGGMNVAVAFGGGRAQSDGEYDDGTFANGYLRFGYAF